MPSADLTYVTPSDVALDATLTITDEGGVATLRLQQNESNAILAEAVLDQELNVRIVGGETADKLTISQDPGTNPEVSIRFDGSGGEDVLVGGDRSNTWQLTAQGAGRLNNIVFTGVERLTGGVGDDAFQLLDPSAGTNVDGRAGYDTLTASDTHNIWTLDGAGLGTLNGEVFVGMEALEGGSSDDLFVFAGSANFAGALNGAGGANTLDYSAYSTAVSVDLSTRAATGTSGVGRFQRVVGGLADDVLVGDSAANTLSGGAGDDLLIGAGGDDIYAVTNGWGSDQIIEAMNGGSDLIDFTQQAAHLTQISHSDGSYSFTDGTNTLYRVSEVEDHVL
jgi:hypothetical protein